MGHAFTARVRRGRAVTLGVALVALNLLAAVTGCGSDDACNPAHNPYCGAELRTFDLEFLPSDGVRIDLNGDGVDEIALVSRGGKHLLIVRRYDTHELLAEPGSPYLIAKGDLDGDGREDLALAIAEPQQLVLMRSGGDGTLARLRTIELKKWTYALETADLNGDGRVELLVADGEQVRIFDALGEELGSYAAGSAPASLVVGDLNADGALDVVAADYEGGDVFSFRGDGQGGLSDAGSLYFGPSAQDLALADADGDGVLDVLVRDRLGGGLWLAVGDGTGAFSSARSLDLGFNRADDVPGIIASAQRPGGLFGVTLPAKGLWTQLFGADGAAVARSEWSSSSTELSFVSDELFVSADRAAPITVQTGPQLVVVAATPLAEGFPGSATSLMAIGDLDGDGHQDIATLDRATCTAHILFGDGSASLDGPWTEGPTLESCQHLATADVDGDGHDELLGLSSDHGIQLAYGDSDREFDVRPAVLERAFYPVVLRRAGTSTLVVESGSHRLSSVLIDDAGDLQPGAELSVDGGYNQFTAADVDGDGDDELVVSAWSTLKIYEQVGDDLVLGPVHDFTKMDPPIEKWSINALTVADLDADGVAEGIGLGEREVFVLRDLDSPVPTVSSTTELKPGSYHGDLKVGDVDGDGHLDLIIDDGGFTVLRGTGAGFVGEARPVPVHAHLLSSGDLDGDGGLDFVDLGDGLDGAEIQVYSARDVTLPSLELGVELPGRAELDDFHRLLHGDLDGDGRTDLLIRQGDFEYLAHGDDGRFSRVTVLREYSTTDADLHLADLDGDGRDERLSVASRGQWISASTLEGSAWSDLPRIQGTGEPHGYNQSLLVADIDGDGIVDVASAWGASEEDVTTGVQIAFGEPAEAAGTTMPVYVDLDVLITRPYNLPLPQEGLLISPPPMMQSADLDGDGRPELIVDGHYQGEVLLLWNEGDRRFRAEVLDATSARIIGAGDLVVIADDVLWRVPVYGRRLGARARVGEVHGRLLEVTECTGDDLPDLLISGSPGMMVGVGASFVAAGGSDGRSRFCDLIDGDERPDIVSSQGATLYVWQSDPPQ